MTKTPLSFNEALTLWTLCWAWIGFTLGIMLGMTLIRWKVGRMHPHLRGKV